MSKKSECTPGPLDWTGSPANATGGCHVYLVDANGRKIAALWGQQAEKEANAALYAAAPDMAKALEAVLMAHNPDAATYTQADAAILATEALKKAGLI